MSIQKYVSSRIHRKRDKILGTAVSIPYLKILGGQPVWVVDVLIRSDTVLLDSVPIAENNRQVRNFVNDGTPVELQRSGAGFFYISGLSDRLKNSVTSKKYSLPDYFLGYTDGWKLVSGGSSYETGSGNSVTPGTQETVTHEYSFELIPFGDLVWGTTPFGAKRYTRT